MANSNNGLDLVAKCVYGRNVSSNAEPANELTLKKSIMHYDHEKTCPKCGTRHRLTKKSISMRDKDSIDCLKCGSKDIFRWNEAKI